MWESFVAGIIASFTPCVAVLFPVVFYRFFRKDKKDLIQFILFIAGFIAAFLVFGYALQGLFTSGFQNGFKLGMGIIFVVLGILSMMNRINPLNFPLIKQPFLLGISFAIILSFSPCTIPFLGFIITLKSQGMIIINLLFFALGIMTPAIIFTIIGRNMVKATNHKLFRHINKFMSILLIISGLYLAITINGFGIHDAYVASISLVLTFALLLRVFFIVHKLKDLLKWKNIVLIAVLLTIITTTMIVCNHHASEKITDNPFSESQQDTYVCTDMAKCETCTRCATIFAIAAAIGLGTIIGIHFYNNKYKKLFKQKKKKKL